MKKKIFFVILLIISSITIQAQENKLKFNETVHDFGVIEEKGGKVSFDFIVTNESTEPLTISNVKASCGCTTPHWTKSPIEPGKTGKITVTYNPQGRPGRFNKSISVTTNFSPTPYSLYIKGEVRRQDSDPATTAPKPQEKLQSPKLPEQAQDNLNQPTPEQIKNAGKINVNAQPLVFSKKLKANTQILKIANSGKSNLNIKAIQSSIPGITFSQSTFVVKPKEIVEVKVTCPVNKVKSVESSTISIFSDDPKNPQKDVKVILNL